MAFIADQDAFLMFLMTSRALNRFIMAVVRIGLYLCRFCFNGISALVTSHAGRFFRNFSRLDVAVTGFTGKIHSLMRTLERHGIGSRGIAGSQKRSTERGCTNREK